MEHKTILFVEDEIETSEAFKNFFERRGYNVLTASNGEEALAVLKNCSCDLILTDIIMPKMDGNELIKEIRKTQSGQGIPIIVITVRKNMRDYFECVGVDSFLSKPCSPQEVLATVEQILNCPSQQPAERPCKRVLVAGRGADYVEYMANLFQENGCHVDFVLSGEQLVSKAVMFLPQVIVLEAEMHGGILPQELVHVLRQMPQFKKIPIIVYSKLPRYEKPEKNDSYVKHMISIEHCLANGANEYIGNYNEKTILAKTGKYIFPGSIVVIDDDKGISHLIKSKTEDKGYKVFTAENGTQGIELVKKVKPNLILLDVVMPGLDGFKILESIKNDPECKNTPVIMVTVKGSDQDVQRGLTLGADDYVTKPFYIGLLLKKIQTFVPA